METPHYVLKAAIGMVFFYSLYWLFLRRHTYFMVNRLYLLAGVMLAMVAPLYKIEYEEPPAQAVVYAISEAYAPVVYVATPPPTAFDWESLIWAVYWLGVVVFLAYCVKNLWQIRKLILSCEPSEEDPYLRLATDDHTPSFSFLKYIVISRNDAKNGLGDVLAHEDVHVRQGHTLDLLFLELVHAFWWFNPIFIMYKKSLKQIHEFLADDYAAMDNRHSYATRLFGYAVATQTQPLTHSFLNSSTLKNRIAMLCKNRSSRWVLSRYMLALPVLATVVMLVAARVPKKVEKITVKGHVTANTAPLTGVNVIVKNTNKGTNTDQNGDYAITVDDNATLVFSYVGYETQEVPVAKNTKIDVELKKKVTQLGPIVVAAYQDTTKKVTLSLAAKPAEVPTDPNFKAVEENAEFQGNLNQYLAKNIKYPAAAQRANVQGTVFLSFAVDTAGMTTNIMVIKGLGFGCDEEAVRLVKEMPRWKPARQNGKAVAVAYKIPIEFLLEKANENKVIVTQKLSGCADPNEPVLQVAEDNPVFNGLYGESISQFIRANLEYPSAAKRANVSGTVFLQFTICSDGYVKDIVVLRGLGFGCDEAAVRFLATKMNKWKPARQDNKNVALRHNMPIKFDFKENEKYGTNIRAAMIVNSSMKNALYVVDGKKVGTSEEVFNLNPEDVETVSVLKNQSAINIYGDEGKNGVVIITTKKEQVDYWLKILESSEEKYCLFVDGKQVKNIKKIKPENIKSIKKHVKPEGIMNDCPMGYLTITLKQ